MSRTRPASWWHGPQAPASSCGRLHRLRGSVPPALPKDVRDKTMAIRGRWKPLVYTVVLSGVVLAGVLGYGRFGVQRSGGNPMNESRFMVDHVRLESDKPFEDVAKAFERQLGRFDPDVAKPLIAGGDSEGARAKIEAMAGPSGFMLFGTTDHGALLRIVAQRRKAIQYVVGNPLFALQMTRHGIRAGLYAPLRVLLYED